jgi:hypothetical protein
MGYYQKSNAIAVTLWPSLSAGLLQIAVGLVCLAVAVVTYPVEYEGFSHFEPAPVQYHQAEPLVKQLVVEKYVS